MLERSGDVELAVAARRRLVDLAVDASGKGSLAHAAALEGEALVLEAEGRLDDAAPLLESVLAMREAALGPSHARVADAARRLARLRRADGDAAGAVALHRRDLAIREAAAPRSRAAATSLNNLAEALAGDDPGAAAALLERACAIWEAAGEDLEFATASSNLARCLDDGGRGDAAAAAARRALAALVRAVGDGGPAVAACHHALGVILRDGDEAEAAFETAVSLKERHFGFGHLRVAASWRGLGKARLRVRKFAEAEQAFRRDVAISEDKLGPDAPELAARYNNYAMLLWRLGRPAEAAPFQEKGLAIKRRLGDAAAERTYDGELDGMLAGEPYPYGGRAA